MQADRFTEKSREAVATAQELARAGHNPGTHTVGFDKWKAYLLGEEDGVAKTPEWQEKETGVPAKDVRALAHPTLGPGFRDFLKTLSI